MSAPADLGAAGAIRLAELAPRGLATPLGREGLALASVADLVQIDDYVIRADGFDMRSPMRFATSEEGDALASAHRDPELRRLVDALAGRPMEPTKRAYLYFGDRVDFIGLHTDIPACELTLLVGVGGEPADLVIYPELRGRAPDEIVELARASDGSPSGGVAFRLDPGEVVALVGGGLPHQTPRAPRSTPGMVVSLCYAGVGAAV